MLRELLRLAPDLEMPPVGYAAAIAHWEIDLNLEGLEPLMSADGKGNPKPGKRLILPFLTRQADNPILISDAGDYVFGWGEKGDRRSSLYRELLTHCLEETGEKGVRDLIDYLERVDRDAVMEEIKAKYPKTNPEKERFVFSYEDEYLTEREAVKNFWAGYYSERQNTEQKICLITGEQKPTLTGAMPVKIKGVPNTQPAGAALSSFDKDAYRSWGWKQMENAPIGFDVAVNSLQSLNYLLREDANHYRLGKEQMFVFWGDVAGEGLNPTIHSNPHRATLVEGLFSRPENPPSNRAMSRNFYFATLKGAKGRIAVSSWNQTEPKRIYENVLNFVELQEAIAGSAKPIWVLVNCAFIDPKKDHTTEISRALFQFVLFGEPLPDSYAIRVIRRIWAEQDALKNFDRAKALALYLNCDPEMSKKTSERFAYHFGRIAFLIHEAEVLARNLNKEETGVTRSLKTLSSTPAQIFPKLYYNCISNHLEGRDIAKPKLMRSLKFRLNEEWEALGEYRPEELPTTFTVREQAQFFIGFAKCRAQWFQKKENKATETQNNPSTEEE